MISDTIDKYLYCILPSGNSKNFPELDAELFRRKIEAKIGILRQGGRIYCIPEKEVSKLPIDEKGHYLGDDIAGHTIYPLINLDGWDFVAWKDVKDLVD